MKSILVVMLSLFAGLAHAQAPVEIKVWPNGAAENNGLTERINKDNFLENTNEAVLYVYSPLKDKNSGRAVVICPGGGYSGLAIKHEGHDVAAWLASEGITGIVLKYRMPNGNRAIPLKDAQEAMRIVRTRAKEFGIDVNKVGVAGFSAGGHLASTLGTHTTDKLLRPDFMVLFYPVISGMPPNIHKGSFDKLLGKERDTASLRAYSNETRITSETPPTLLLHSDDDKVVPPMNSILFYEALKKNNIKSSLYVFPGGGHGWGYNKSFAYYELWKPLVLNWLKQL